MKKTKNWEKNNYTGYNTKQTTVDCFTPEEVHALLEIYEIYLVNKELPKKYRVAAFSELKKVFEQMIWEDHH